MPNKNTRTRLITINGKKVRAHRYIMEQYLGRKLNPTEHIHHINKDPLDNRIENLAVLESKEHMQLHKQKYPDIKICEVCGNIYAPNPRKRKRQKCCGKECAHILRVRNMSITRYGYSPATSLSDSASHSGY